MRRLAFFFVGASVFLPAAQAAPLRLEEAVAEALAHSDLLAAKAAQVEAAGADAAVIRTQRLPRVKVEAMSGYLLDEVEFVFPRGALGNYPATGPIPGDDIAVVAGQDVTVLAQVQIAQPLSQLPRIGWAARAADAGRAVAEDELAAARLELAAAVRGLYFGLLEKSSSLRSTAAAIERLRELLRTVEANAEKQTILRADLLEARLALATKKHEKLLLENAETSQREELLRLLGRPLDSPLELAELPAPERLEEDLATARATALERRPDLAAARHRLEAAELSFKAEKAGRWPELSLALQYLAPYQLDLLPNRITTVGLQLSWEPWDWGRRKKQLASRDADVRAARGALRDAEGQVLTEVGRAFRRLGEKRAAEELARLSEELAAERLRLAQARLAQDAALPLDVLSAEASLAEAEARARASRLDLWQAHSDFMRQLAEDLP